MYYGLCKLLTRRSISDNVTHTLIGESRRARGGIKAPSDDDDSESKNASRGDHCARILTI